MSEAAELAAGMPAPGFTLASDRGGTVSLAEFRGRRHVVLFFYPQDMTPGCTLEACAFRDRSAEMAELDAAVLGVSPDDLASHRGFAAAHGLNFPLLVDDGARVAQAYGAWKEKSSYGRTYMGIERSTFLIDKEGLVRRVWRKVKVEGHDAEVLAALRGL